MTYYRIGRIIYRDGNTRRIRVYTASSAFRAALAVRALNRGEDCRPLL